MNVKSENSIFALCICGFIILFLLLTPVYEYLLHPDAVVYLNMAKKFTQGDFSTAFQGVWSPLYAFTLIPFLLLSIPPFLILKIHAGIVGILLLWGVKLLIDRVLATPHIRAFSMITITILILLFSLLTVTPDLLVLCILVFYFVAILKIEQNQRFWPIITASVLAGAGYWTKSFVFYFFIIHIVIVFLILLWLKKKTLRQALSGICIGLLSFLLIAAPLILLFSVESQKFAISSVGSFNMSVVGHGYPYYYVGLTDPPPPPSTSAWDNPTIFAYRHWSPFDSFNNFKRLAWLVRINIAAMGIIFLMIVPFIATVPLMWIVRKRMGPLPEFREYPFLLFLASSILYTGGYILLMIQMRYIYIVLLLLTLLTFISVETLERTIGNRGIIKMLAGIIVTCAFVSTLGDLSGKFLFAYRLEHFIRYIESKGITHSKIATSNTHEAVDQETILLITSYVLHNTFHGMPTPGATGKEIENELLKHDIDYYFDVNGVKPLPGNSVYRELPPPRVYENLTIYKNSAAR